MSTGKHLPFLQIVVEVMVHCHGHIALLDLEKELGALDRSLVTLHQFVGQPTVQRVCTSTFSQTSGLVSTCQLIADPDGRELILCFS